MEVKIVAVISFLSGFFVGVWACALTAERTTWEILPPEPDVFEAYPKEEWNKL